MTAIDPSRALGAPLAPAQLSWSAAQVALYHLGVGADGSEPDELLEQRLVPLPTFAALASLPALIHLDEVPGLAGLDLARVLHGEHRLELGGPVPRSGSVRTTGVVEAIERKRSGALIAVRQESRWPDGELAWVNRYAMFARGAVVEERPEAAPAPSSATVPPARVSARPLPDRLPDAVATSATLPQQAALYRHSGDDNPLHLDPAYARAGGFERPILQGLCTLGIALRAICRELLGDERTAVRTVAVRFAGVVLPGQSISTSMWLQDGAIAFATETDAGAPVLAHGSVATGDGRLRPTAGRRRRD